MRYNSCLVRLGHEKKNIAPVFHTEKTLDFVSTPPRYSAKSRLAVCSTQSPDPFFLLLTFRWSTKHLTGNVCLQGLQSPHGDRFKLRTNEVSSLILEMTLVQVRLLSLMCKHPSGHIAIELRFISYVAPKIDFPRGTSFSLIQEYSCRSFICVISRSSPALNLSAESQSVKAPS